MKYHKQPDGTISYCYQCYKQKRLGSTKTRIKKGLDISDSCDTPVVQEWKLILMSNIIFNTIWNDKERIIEMANQLIEETIQEDSYQNDIKEEIVHNENKISGYQLKMQKLLDMYLNDMIDKDNYLLKKEELENNLKAYLQLNEEVKSKITTPKEVLKTKLQNLKQNIIDNLNYNDNHVSEEVIDLFVKKITIKEDKFDWKLNYLDGIIESNLKDDLTEDNDIFLTRIVITKDDVTKFLEFHKEYRFLRLKEPIKVDIYL